MLFIAAVTGDSFGYWCGKRFGPSIFSRRGALLLDRAHVGTAEAFYARHGGKTIVLARFVPIVRTFAPILAGVGSMRYRTFLAYNLMGGAIWAFGLSWMGYFLGARIPHIDRYLLPIIGVIITVSVAPTLIHLLTTAEGRARTRATVRAIWNRRAGAPPPEEPAVPAPAEKDSAPLG
ncbi:MAG: rane-associated protein [Miltoncostaeaceae bacterium]|jgi:membrane-associated protein|nr:rane-associated protein [Miltoncostaeaceae bacterium]